jgi:hypothetical protein
MFDHFWDFDRLVEGGAQGEAETAGSRPLFRDFWVKGLCNGYGMSTHGFTHALAPFVIINRNLGDVSRGECGAKCYIVLSASDVSSWIYVIELDLCILCVENLQS